MVKSQRDSPKVKSVSWGRIEVEGHDSPYRDAKLFPGGAREWDWNETGTGHSPGVQPADVEELIENGATTVVIGTGVFGRLRVDPATEAKLDEQGVRLIEARTESAVEQYNELTETAPVGGLFHTTC